MFISPEQLGLAGLSSRGMGAYPDQPYYDPDRPGWLPYWIDDEAESLAKYNAANLLQATANAAGMATGSVVGTVADSAGSAVANLATSLFSNVSTQSLLIIGGVLGLVVFVPMLGKRR